MARLEPGRTLAHYRILGQLGQGGQATAYKAEDERLHRLVVLKALRPELAASEPARRRFEQEACLSSALEHPNICAIYDIGETDGLFYIAMQYVEGRTLKELMSGRPLATLTVLSLAIQIADALAVAHAQGIVHRDVKPGNIMVTPSGQAKVLDFGLAKALAGPRVEGEGADRTGEPLTEAGVPYGSLGYGSPEQASGAETDHRSDIFSLGVVIHEMATGQAPFKRKNRMETLRAVIGETPPPITELSPGAPPGLQAILSRALAKDPRERFQTMAALRDELKALMRQLSRETGFVPTEASATLLSPEHAHRRRLGRTIDRVLGRLRAPARMAPPPSVPGRAPAWSRQAEERTIAVLPFRNLSGDPAFGFYEFSLADGIITELARLPSLVVRPSFAIAEYVGQNVDPRRVGEDLAVESVLTGSFIRVSGRLRVSVQLVSVESGRILWSERVDIAEQDLITVQDAIAGRVVAGLRLRDAERERPAAQPPTRSPQAYEHYLRGRDRLFRYICRTFDDADLETAIRAFNEAVGLDPDFARAHAGLGHCYVHHAQGYGGPEYYTLAERSLRRALELEPTLVEARLQMVYVDLHHGDKERARSTVQDLMREAPNDPGVLFVAGMLYRLDGLYAEALEVYDRLLQLNPHDVVIVSFNRARVFTHARQYESAMAELERARALEPDHPLVKTFLAIALFNQGRLDEAQALLEEIIRQNPHLDGVQPLLAWCLSARGEHEQARALITERVKETAAADHDIALWLASFYAMEGMLDEAMEWLQRAVRLGNENYPLFADSRKLAALRGDPRFHALMEELKELWETRRRDPRLAGGPEATSGR